MYTLSIQQIRELLIKENLLKEIVSTAGWHLTFSEEINPEQTLNKLSYDSRNVDASTLFFCKGLNFKPAFLDMAIEKGSQFYVSEQPYEVAACGFIVTDIRQAMAIIAKHFYQNPQDKLQKVAITGTKGKTTTAYLLKGILEQATNYRTALFSSEETTVDGKTYQKSALTTPEALDLFAQMAQAVENGLTHLVMEVSSQAYKTQRVFGLTFDIGIFLNIGEDHISPIEHPTFDDYLFCKRQLIQNSKQMIINRDSEYFDLLQESCAVYNVPLLTFGQKEADFCIQATDDAKRFVLSNADNQLTLNDTYQLGLIGTFNYYNAAAAIIASRLVDAPQVTIKEALPNVTIPGRMNVIEQNNQPLVLVDYAHNYLSMKSISLCAKELRPNGQLFVVTGSAGEKAHSRRPDIGKALSEFADIAILTADDPNFEDPQAIADEIAATISNPAVTVHFEMNRQKAVEQALEKATPEDVIVVAGKGIETFMKIQGIEEPYLGDDTIARQWFN